MYVVTHNDQVLLGPMRWNSRMFNSVILDDTEIVTNILPSDEDKAPLDLGDGLLIRHATNNYPDLNPKTQMYTGPIWTFTPTEGVANYTVVDKPIELVRKELKEVLAAERYKKEVTGTTALVQGQIVTIDTSRDGRSVYVQQFLLLDINGTVNWKFPECWLLLTKTELGSCVQAGVDYIQAAFKWESDFITQIDTLTTLSDLDSLEIISKVSGIKGA